MRLINFPGYIKPLLRRTGLVLLALYLISVIFTILTTLPLTLPGLILDTVTQFLDLSSLLVLAILMLALSLAEYARVDENPDRKILIGFRDRILLRGRFLVILAGVLFLLLIPYSFFQAQLLRNTGLIGLEDQAANMKIQLSDARTQLANPDIKEQFLPMLMQRYSPIIGKEIMNVRSISDLRDQVEASLNALPKETLAKKSQAENDLWLRLLRISLFCVLYFFIFLNIWLYWPTGMVFSQQKSLTADLGFEIETEDPL